MDRETEGKVCKTPQTKEGIQEASTEGTIVIYMIMATNICPSMLMMSLLDGNEFFEVRQAANKGLGIFARQNLKAGTRILLEKPIMVISKHVDSITFEDAVQAHCKLPPSRRQQFARLRSPLDYPDFDPSTFGISKTSELTSQQLIFLRVYANKHGITDSSSTREATGIYHVCSLFNHSCQPNARIINRTDGTRECRVFEDLQAGTEITFSYNDAALYMPLSERQQNFKGLGLPEPCMCQSCIGLSVDRRIVSDMRRYLLRRLYIYIHGQDLEVPHTVDVANVRAGSPAVSSLDELLPFLTVWLFMFATIAEAECTIGSDQTYSAYANAAILLVKRAKSLGLRCVPLPALKNVHRWWEKSMEISRKVADVETRDSSDLNDWGRVVEALGPNGEIPELDDCGTFVTLKGQGSRAR